ncbi:hypothetical protein EXN66_Car000205 [Channa argus]|uniref:Uncharacterized protein n=1 Tax=Channa argus TaxID=215402 RepID=A0A6G1QXK3_CHAAH|nr:hypothetical protein EXN66_Car000205 [Channa argus]
MYKENPTIPPGASHRQQGRGKTPFNRREVGQVGRTSSCTLEKTQLKSPGTPAERDRERETEKEKDYGRKHTE